MVISVVAIAVVESLSRVRLFMTRWTVTCTGRHIGFTNSVTSYRITQTKFLANQIYLQDLLVGFKSMFYPSFMCSWEMSKFLCALVH